MTVTLAPPVVDAYADAELRLGRPLTLAERNIDIVGLDKDLATGKAKLADAIDKEKRRALNAFFRYRLSLKLKVTPEMIAALEWLYAQGVKHGRREVEDLTGIKLPKQMSQKDDIDKITGRLNKHLHKYQSKVVEQAAVVDLGETATIAATRTVLQMPGALNIASQLVSSTAFMGIGSVYDTHEGLFGAWTYSAVMDNNTCEDCETHDGEEFQSWDELMSVLPDGGPNPDCFGEGRCRCRGVPSELSPMADQVGGGGGILPSAAEGDPLEAEVLDSEAAATSTITTVRITEETHDDFVNEIVGWPEQNSDVAGYLLADALDNPNLTVLALHDESGALGALVSYQFTSDRMLLLNEIASRGARGEGTTLLREVAGRAADRGYGVRLAATNEAAPYYERLGFKRVSDPNQSIRIYELDPAEAKAFAKPPAPKPAVAKPTSGTDDYKLLPKHAQQPVESLTVAEAQAQLKKIEGNIRGLHWHAKNGRPINPEKLAAYERRQSALRQRIEHGGVPTRPVEPPVAPPVAPPAPPVAPPPIARVPPPPVVAPAPYVSPGNPFVGRTADELKADLTKRNNQIAGIKKQLKANPEGTPRHLELRTRLTKLEHERSQIKEATKGAPKTTTRATPVAPRAAGTGKKARDYFHEFPNMTPRNSAYETLQHSEFGLDMLDKVFVRMEDKGVKVNEINLGFTKAEGIYGRYIPYARIDMSSKARAVSDTLWHEFAHHMDEATFKTQRAYGMLSHERDGDLQPVLDVIGRSEAYARIMALKRDGAASRWARKNAAYLSTPHEQFARAFAQYMLRKTEMLYQEGKVDESAVRSIEKSRLKVNDRATDGFGTQWTDSDFQPIYDALDKFFRERGWLR